jgi:hypothetical protein
MKQSKKIVVNFFFVFYFILLLHTYMNHIGVNGREMVHFSNFGGHTNIGQKYSHICKVNFRSTTAEKSK